MRANADTLLDRGELTAGDIHELAQDTGNGTCCDCTRLSLRDARFSASFSSAPKQIVEAVERVQPCG